MKLRNFLVLIALFTLTIAFNANARKPAVEPVVGVEPESYKATSVGTEVQFNFGNFIHAKTPKKSNPRQINQTPNWLATSTLFAFIMLPFFMWFAITRSTAGLQTNEEQVATTQPEHHHEPEVTTPSNVTNLSDFKTKSSGDKSDKKDGGKKAA